MVLQMSVIIHVRCNTQDAYFFMDYVWICKHDDIL